MRLILGVSADFAAAVQFFDDANNLIVEAKLTGADFGDALEMIVGRAMKLYAHLNVDEQARKLIEDIHQAAFTREAILPTPLHDRLLDWLKKAGGKTS